MFFLEHLKNWFQFQLNEEIKDTGRQLETNSGELRWVDYFSTPRAWDCGLINSVEFYFLCTLHLPCINVLSSPRVQQEHKKIVFWIQATGPRHSGKADEIAATALGLSNCCPGLNLVTVVAQSSSAPLVFLSLTLSENTPGCIGFPWKRNTHAYLWMHARVHTCVRVHTCRGQKKIMSAAFLNCSHLWSLTQGLS